jgi:hypothetical protein
MMQLVAQSFTDDVINGEIFDAALQVFTSVVPLPILAMLVFGSVGISYYMVQRAVIIPAILVILIGGVTVAEMPTTVQQGITAGLVLAMAGIGYVLLQRVRT